ncbi:MAG: hypothetical protein HYV09_16070 [Deltaproteobacteria bacterium]|nr:hypothetical protein [Deltaproteobacteria bacterium]
MSPLARAAGGVLLAGLSACSPGASEPAREVPGGAEQVEIGFRRVADRWVHRSTEVSRDGVAVVTRGGAPCRFRTVSIAGASVAPNGPTRIGARLVFERGGGVREVIRPHALGVEQQWELAEGPTGAFEIVVGVEGSFRGDDGERARFGCADGGEAFYGAATLVDARGQRTRLSREVRDGRIAIRISADVLARATFPAVVDPIVGAEFPVEAPVGLAVGPSYEGRFAVRAAPDHWLVGWTFSDGLWLGRIRADGSIAWPVGVRVGPAYQRAMPAFSFDGTNWLVAWAPVSGAVATRFGLDGTALDGTPIALGWPGGDALAAWDGTRHVVVDASSGRGACVAPSGTISATFEPASGDVRWSDLACRSSGSCMMAGKDAVTGALVVRQIVGGVAAASNIVVHGSPRWDPSRIAWTGANWAISFVDSSGQVLVRRLASDGTVLGTTSLGTGWVPDVSCSADACRVTFDDGATGVLTTRLDASGAVLDPITKLFPMSTVDTKIGCGASRCLAVQKRYPLRALRTEGAATLDAVPFTVGWIPSLQWEPTAAASGAGGLVVWTDERGDPPAWVPPSPIFGTRVSPTGLLDSAATLLVDGSASQLRAAWDGTDWLLAYINGGNAELARFGTTLTKKTTQPLLGRTPHDLVCNASACLYAWRDGGDLFYRAFGQVLPKGAAPSARMSLLGPPPEETATEHLGAFAVGAGPDGFLCVHRRGSALVATRIGNDGTILDKTPTPVGSVGTDATAGVANVAGTWVIAWNDRTRVSAIRLSSTGLLLDATPLQVTSTVAQRGIGVVPAEDGHTALVTWDARAAFVASDGRVLDPGGFALDAQWAGRGAAIAPGKVLVPYVRYGGFVGSTRAVARVVESGAMDGSPCTTGTSCASRICSDGHCCDGVCTEACSTCATGKCVSVVSADDADSCTGTLTCSATGACKSKLGTACASAAECASGHCADSVCCDAVCTGACSTCATGKCMSVVSADDADTCTGTLTCSATGACKSKLGAACASAAECASGHCADGVCCATACGPCGVCNVTPGACTARAAGTLSSCAPFLCDGSAITCATTCGDDAGCAADAFCASDKTCKARKPNGAACNPDDCASGDCRNCASGHCVAGVCCDSACDGPCGICNETGSVGSCIARPKGTAADCGAFLCAGASTSCPTSCTTSADCVAGHWCDASKCVPRAARGGACKVDDACLAGIDGAGHCVDGLCCDTPCNGLCEACDGIGAVGTCTPVVGDPHGKRAPCPTDVSEPICGRRTCDGVSRASCEKLPGSETACGSASVCSHGRCLEADSGVSDGGAEPSSETGVADAGSDTGTIEADASDAGVTVPEGPPADEGTGCGCRVGARPRGHLALIALLAVVVRRRRPRSPGRNFISAPASPPPR